MLPKDKMKNKKIIFNLLILVSLSVILSLNVLAFGVSTPYWENNELVVAPGETKEIHFTLQNMVGAEDVTMKVELLEGSEIVELTDDNLEYLVPIGTKDTDVNMQIKMPEDAALDTEYTVVLAFKTVQKSQEGMVQMGGGMEKSFKVVARLHAEEPEVQEEAKAGLSQMQIFFIAIIVIVILIFIYKYKKSHKKK